MTGVHMVWTRAIDGVPMAGRPNVARQIRANLTAAGYRITESTIRPITSDLTLGRLLEAARNFLAALWQRRPLPMQCLLFGARAEADRVLDELPGDCALVYLDGVRCLRVLETLRQMRPGLGIVTDLDDLMSRRMSLLLGSDQAPSTGYLKSQMPGLVERLLAWRLPRRLVLRYEAASLVLAEQRVATLSDCVALISSEDAVVLRQRVPECDVRALPFAVADRCAGSRQMQPPYRFVFVGTDALRQNQLTIDALLRLWRSEGIATPLVIYGLQQRQYDLPPAVTMAGYAESLDDIYDDHSILLSPSYLAGGVKTKVLEAFAFSCPVVGNSITFEAIGIGSEYPLVFDSAGTMLPLLRQPGAYADLFTRAAAIGKLTLRRDHDPAKVRKAWRDIVETAAARRARPLAGDEPRQTRGSSLSAVDPDHQSQYNQVVQ